MYPGESEQAKARDLRSNTAISDDRWMSKKSKFACMSILSHYLDRMTIFRRLILGTQPAYPSVGQYQELQVRFEELFKLIISKASDTEMHNFAHFSLCNICPTFLLGTMLHFLACEAVKNSYSRHTIL